MNIERVIVKNYRALRDTDIVLRPGLNIVVGDNEAGKSTLLEAINLALKGQLNRRPVAYELHPFLFNVDAVGEFIASHKAGRPEPPPEICIEVYLKDAPELADLRGSNNRDMANQPGVSLSIRLDQNFAEEYREYVRDPKLLNSVPVEYYEVVWQSFAGHPMTSSAMPIRSALIDPSLIPNTYSANKYVLEVVRDYLSKKQQVDLALSYRRMRDLFLKDHGVSEINEELAEKKGIVSEKTLSMGMDTTTRASWETGVLPHLDGVPLPLVGRGEQSSVKIKLAIEAAEGALVVLMEEPENHLSHSNLNRLIGHIASRSKDKQLIITTHSSFVLNKLGVENTLMFNGRTAITLSDLPEDTKRYFMKLPGHDTLRMILSSRTILVEGPSDELIVQKAYCQEHGRWPLEDGVEVIAVNALAFRRFLDIARQLNIGTSVVTDNDKKPETVAAKYAEYQAEGYIRICYSRDATLPTLEPQLLKVNGREKLNFILGAKCGSDEKLLAYMTSNKADVALRIFESAEQVVIPEYIMNAIK